MLLSKVHLGTTKCTYIIALHPVPLTFLFITLHKRTATDFISGKLTAAFRYTRALALHILIETPSEFPESPLEVSSSTVYIINSDIRIKKKK